MKSKRATRSPWLFVPTQYFVQAIPYVAVNYLSVVIYTRLGASVEAIGLMTSLISLPWVIKPLWSPLVDWLGTRRAWHLWSTVAISACFAMISIAFQSRHYFAWSLVVFTLCGFISATYDIATDGYYLHALDKKAQAFFSGIRSLTWRFGFMFTNGLLVMLAGSLTIKQLDHTDHQTTQEAKTMIAEIQGIATSEVDKWLLSDPKTVKRLEKADQAKRDHILRMALIEQMVSIDNEARRTVELSQKDTKSLEQTIVKEIQKRIKAANRGKKDTSLIAANTRDEFVQRVMPERVALAKQQMTAGSNFLSEQRKATAGAWSKVFLFVAFLLLALAILHGWLLPYPESDIAVVKTGSGVKEAIEIFVSFFRQPGIVTIVAFILLYRFGEAFLMKMASVFLLRELGLTNAEYAWGYSVLGVIGLASGGVIGGWLISRYGLKRTIWPLALAMNLPDLLYVYMAIAKPSVYVVYAMIGLEQFGFGLGFTAFMVFLMYTSKGQYRTAHYAIATGLMALAMMVAGMVSGYLIAALGYTTFFIVVSLCTVPGMLLIPFLKINE